jgi:hypothetical protein
MSKTNENIQNSITFKISEKLEVIKLLASVVGLELFVLSSFADPYVFVPRGSGKLKRHSPVTSVA